MLRPVVAVSLAALAALVPAASAATGVRVTINDRATVFLSSADIESAPDQVDPRTQVTVRGSDGDESTATEGGASVAEVARLAHILPEHVEGFVVTGNDHDIALTHDEVLHGFTGDPLGLRFATISVQNGPPHFFRPMRTRTDANRLDRVDTPINVDLPVAITTDNTEQRDVTASADDTTLDPGDSTGFSARLEDPPSRVSFTYDWDFGDGTHAQGSAPSHAFAAGHYRVRVSVVGDDGSSGISDPIDIQVGSPDAATPGPTPSPAPQSSGPAGTGDGPPGPGANGSDGPAGGGEGDAKDAANGKKRRKPKPDRPTPRASATPTPTPTPAASAAPGRTPAPSPAPPARAKPTPTPTPTPTATPPPSAPGVPPRSVDGILLAGTAPTNIGELLRKAAKQSPAAVPVARRGGGGGSVLGWVGGGALFVALLAAGAAAELRGLR